MSDPDRFVVAACLRAFGRMSKGKPKNISENERAARRLRMAHARLFRWKNFVSVGNPCEHSENKEDKK